MVDLQNVMDASRKIVIFLLVTFFTLAGIALTMAGYMIFTDSWILGGEPRALMWGVSLMGSGVLLAILTGVLCRRWRFLG